MVGYPIMPELFSSYAFSLSYLSDILSIDLWFRNPSDIVLRPALNQPSASTKMEGESIQHTEYGVDKYVPWA